MRPASTTTLLPTLSLGPASIGWNAGWQVILRPLNRLWPWRTTWGAAHTAPTRPTWFARTLARSALSRSLSAPGIPPGTATRSKLSPTTSPIISSATIVTCLEQRTALSASTDATLTSIPALLRTSARITASISSVPFATGTRAVPFLDDAARAAILTAEAPRALPPLAPPPSPRQRLISLVPCSPRLRLDFAIANCRNCPAIKFF